MVHVEETGSREGVNYDAPPTASEMKREIFCEMSIASALSGGRGRWSPV